MNRAGNWLVLLLCVLCVPLRGESLSPAAWFQRRFHPDIVSERDVEGIESRIVNGKLVLHLDDFIALLLKNSTNIRLTQLDVYTAADAVTAAKAPFDPQLLLSFNSLRTEQPEFNQISGAPTLNSLTESYSAAYSQVIGTGPTVTAGFTAIRSSSNSAFNIFNPSISDTLNFQVTQPLLQGRGNLQLRAPILIARAQLRITSEQSQTAIADTIANASAQYWDAIRVRDSILVAQRSLDLARKSYDRDKQALELGALSRLDIFQSESQVAQRKLDVIQAQYAYRQALDGLRRLIGADLKPQTRYIDIVLEDDPSALSPASSIQSLPDSVAKALRDRPEMSIAGRRVSIDGLNARVARNSLLPRLDLSLNGGAAGLAGNQVPGVSIISTPIVAMPGGLGDSLQQLFTFSSPYYGFGVTLGIPIRSSSAKAALADSLVNRTRDEYTQRQTEQQIILDVKNAVSQVELAREAVNAAVIARDLARKNVDAEQQKYELGTITSFELLDAQSRLATVENSLINALVDSQRALIAYQRATWSLPYQIEAMVPAPKQP